MDHLQCPICGKYSSIGLYDPSNFEDDILIVKFRGLGRGKGFEIADKYSLFDGSDPDLLDLISDRVAVIYDLLYEDDEGDEEEEGETEDDDKDDESLSELEKVLRIIEAEDDDEGEDINELDEEMIDPHGQFTQEEAQATR